jgi:hypothetical protein
VAVRVLAAAVMPTVCFLGGRHVFGLVGAVALTVIWDVGYQLLSWSLTRTWSVLVALSLGELALRSIVALGLGSAASFFVVPSIVTAALGALYLGSGLAERPLIAFVAAEVLPSYLFRRDRGHDRGFLRLASIVYGAEQMVVAGVSIALALTLPTSSYAVVHPPVSWSTFGCGALLLLGLQAARMRRRARRRSDRAASPARSANATVAAVA